MIGIVLTAFIGPFLPGQAFAGGPVHGGKAAGMGTAFVGPADDPSAVLFNPAGIAQITGTQVYGGITVLRPSTAYTNDAGLSLYRDRSVRNGILNGTYENVAHYLGISIGRTF